ncbi:MAG: hypothetical protein HWE27_13180 [Gammaproteobacteria bacterium]|nr:hypothetical protein [Gammaproteobacteria bacterium]
MFKPLAFGLICLTPFAVESNQLPTNNVEKCVSIKDDNERLSCYDKLFKSDGKTVLSQSQSINKKTDLDNLSGVTTQKPNNPSSKNITNESEDQTITLQQSDIFGLEKEVENLSLEKLDSKIIGKFSEWKKGTKFKLENGQEWQVINSRTLYHTVENPEVTIEKGAFGSFYLRFNGMNRRLKVKRLK